METLQNIIVLLFVLATHPTTTTGDIGDSCISRCSDFRERCVNGFCQCDDRSTTLLKSILSYKEGSLEPHCVYVTDGCSQVTWRNYCDDKPNTHCKNNVCVCEGGFYNIGKTCQRQKVTLVGGPLERCGRSLNPPHNNFLCDIEKRLICKNELCGCYDKYVPNLDKNICEPEADYLKRHNLTEYRVLPGEYCKENKHCVEGLVCKNFKCACPIECTFIQKDKYYFCDCGESGREIAGPCITGIILGLIIILCWRCKIKSTIRKYKKLPEIQEAEPEEIPAPSYGLVPSYGLQPTVPAAEANTGADPPRLTANIAPIIGASANIHQLPEAENNFMLPPENNEKMSGSPHYPLNPAMGAMPYPVNSVQPEAYSINEPPPSYTSLGFSQPADNTPYPHTYIPLSTTSPRLDSPAQNQPSGGGFKLPSASGPSYPLNPASDPSAPPLVNLDSLTSSANSAPAYPLGPAESLYPPNPSAPAYPIGPSNLPPEIEALQPPYNPTVKEGYTDKL